MRDSVPNARYSSVCNVLRQWSISLIPTYRVGRLYDKQNKFQDYELKNYKNCICNAKVHEVLLISA